MSAGPRGGRPRGGWHSVPVPRRPLDVPTAAGLALGAVADLLLGDPRRGHPVAGFGTVAAVLERWTWRNSRAAGAGYAMALTAAATGIGVATDRGTRRHLVARALLTAAAAWTVLGGTSLGRAARNMHRALAAGNLTGARAALPALAGRDPAGLEGGELARAPGRGGGGRPRPGHGRVGRREHRRRRRRPAVLGRGGGTAGSARLPGGEHPGRDGRPPVAAVRAVRLGGCAAGRRRPTAG